MWRVSASCPALPTGDCASVRVESPDPKSWVSMALVSDREGRPSSERVLGYRAVLQKIKFNATKMLQNSRRAWRCIVDARTKEFAERILHVPHVAATKGARPVSFLYRAPRAKVICSRYRPARGDRIDASEAVGAALPERPQMSGPVERAARGRRRAVGAPWSYSFAGEAS